MKSTFCCEKLIAVKLRRITSPAMRVILVMCFSLQICWNIQNVRYYCISSEIPAACTADAHINKSIANTNFCMAGNKKKIEIMFSLCFCSVITKANLKILYFLSLVPN